MAHRMLAQEDNKNYGKLKKCDGFSSSSSSSLSEAASVFVTLKCVKCCAHYRVNVSVFCN